jgi:hypothetical protein
MLSALFSATNTATISPFVYTNVVSYQLRRPETRYGQVLPLCSSGHGSGVAVAQGSPAVITSVYGPAE